MERLFTGAELAPVAMSGSHLADRNNAAGDAAIGMRVLILWA